MNGKDSELMRIVDNVIVSCSVLDNDGDTRLSREIVFGKSRRENVQMVRTMLACQIIAAGFTVSTVATLLKRTPQAIRKMLGRGYLLSRTSRAYRIAEKEATLLNKQE